MESLVYENSPLADYLQGSSHPPKHRKLIYSRVLESGEGENEENWLVQEMHSEDEADPPPTDFAPRGASKFQERVRNKLPKPLDLTNTRHGKAVEKLYSACSVVVPVTMVKSHILTVGIILVRSKCAHRTW